MDRFSTILAHLGIETLSDMQRDMCRTADGKCDIQLLSPTGSGKTVAYLLPLIQLIRPESDDLQAIIVVPSRELAQQSEAVLKQMRVPLKALCLHGGRPAMDEHRRLREVRPQVVFATPGRLCDHLTKGNLRTEQVFLLVIDEFDKCLELGFEEDMKRIIGQLPPHHTTWLLSATAPEEATCFVSKGNMKLLDYTVQNTEREQRIDTTIVHAPIPDKLETLARLLSRQGEASSIVFVAHRESAERVGGYLRQTGFTAEVYHGGMEQQHRERAVFRFRSGGSNILVSTDLAARGLDIPHVDAVIHYHLPADEAAYVHRCGRTARWERCGNNYLIIGPKEQTPEYVNAAQEIDVDTIGIRPVRPQWCTLYIGRGKKDKLSKGDIVGFFCKKGGLRGTDINHIFVGDHQAYVSIARNRFKEVMKSIAGEKIKGMKTIIEEMSRH